MQGVVDSKIGDVTNNSTNNKLVHMVLWRPTARELIEKRHPGISPRTWISPPPPSPPLKFWHLHYPRYAILWNTLFSQLDLTATIYKVFHHIIFLCGIYSRVATIQQWYSLNWVVLLHGSYNVLPPAAMDQGMISLHRCWKGQRWVGGVWTCSRRLHCTILYAFHDSSTVYYLLVLILPLRFVHEHMCYSDVSHS